MLNRDWQAWEAWEREYERSRPVDYERNLRIYSALYAQAVALGVLPRKDPLEGLDFKIRLARDLNVSRPD